jgi:hypothetical protein
LTRNKNEKNAKAGNQNLWLGIIAVVLIAGIAWFAVRPADNPAIESATAIPEASALTLSPALFQGVTREAYQVARDIPEVLEELPCFCGCMKERGHQSNLDCFKDDHSSYCAVCQNIALDAANMHKRGSSVEEIRKAVVNKYAGAAP